MVTVLAIGLVVAFVVDESVGVRPGGYIVPGYLAIAGIDVTRLMATLVMVLVVVAILHVADRVMLLYGRRRFAFALLTGCVLKAATAVVLPSIGLAPIGLLVIGFVIPGLVANACVSQGVGKTLVAVVLAVSLTKLLALAVLG